MMELENGVTETNFGERCEVYMYFVKNIFQLSKFLQNISNIFQKADIFVQKHLYCTGQYHMHTPH